MDALGEWKGWVGWGWGKWGSDLETMALLRVENLWGDVVGRPTDGLLALVLIFELRRKTKIAYKHAPQC